MSSIFGYTSQVAVSADEKKSLLAFAEQTAKEAGLEALPFFRSQMNVENKRSDGGFDPVTAADHAVENKVREAIARIYPDHGICGEEFGYQEGNGLTWVIDPIDGTRAFMSGMLHWGLLLALFDGQEPVLGIMYQPYVDELFSGNGEQAWFSRGGERRVMRTSECRSLEDSVLCTTGVDWFTADERVQFERLRVKPKLTQFGGDCYIHALVAMGSVDLATDATLNAYDIQALIPIVRGAGGVVTTYDGGSAAMGGTVLCSANEYLHVAALQEVRQG